MNMKTFVVTTISTFKNKYVVKAVSEEDARRQVETDHNNDFFQKHLGEPVRKVKGVKASTEEEMHALREKLRDKGYW